MKLLARIVGIFSIAVFLMWCVGSILSDRWGWSQWLAWIPTLFIVVLFTFACALFCFTRKKIFALIFGGITAATLFWFCLAENRLLNNSNQKGQIKIVGWTMSHPKERVAEKSAAIIVQLNGDITLLTHGWRVRGEKSIQDWLGSTGRKVINSQFTLLTKFTPLQVRSLIASDGIYISSFVLDTTAVLGQPLVLWAVDFPSSLSQSKMDIARRINRLLQTIETEPPDIVIGDCNMTRNSFALRSIFPDLRDAATLSGSGLLASFPIEFPLYHIDHILVGSQLNSIYYELVNPHIGRHRIQIAEISDFKEP